ncbi:MAG: mannitol dehydrogenase family protein, partial [Paraburkholderia tropica]
QRVAADGFSKIPGFIAPTIAQRIAAGATPAATAVLPALFLRFLQRWNKGVLPYQYQDGVMDGVAVAKLFEAANPLAAFAADKLLWGSLAGGAPLEGALREALARVDAWLARRGSAA